VFRSPGTDCPKKYVGLSLSIEAATCSPPSSIRGRRGSECNVSSQSGCSISSNASTTVGSTSLDLSVATLQGSKRSMPGWKNQDSYITQWLSEERLLVGIFDGHGIHGHLVSARVKQLFEQHAHSLLPNGGPPTPEAFRKLFAMVHSTIAYEGFSQWSGTTVVLGIIDTSTRTLSTAHVGDSRLIVTRDHGVTFSTADHVITPEDGPWVAACGGEVRRGTGPSLRIFGRGMNVPGLAMARSLGDLEAHKFGASAEPSVCLGVPFDPTCDTLVVASDGVWDVLSNSQVAIKAEALSESTAQDVVQTARLLWPFHSDIDDITAVVVRSS